MTPQTDYRITQDGDQWCATAPGFTDLQECVAAFGDTPAQAFAHLMALCPVGALPTRRENPKLLKGTGDTLPPRGQFTATVDRAQALADAALHRGYSPVMRTVFLLTKALNRYVSPDQSLHGTQQGAVDALDHYVRVYNLHRAEWTRDDCNFHTATARDQAGNVVVTVKEMPLRA